MWEWVRGRKPEVGQSLDPFSAQTNDTEEQWWDRNHLWVTSERDERYELGDRMTIGRGYAPTLPASTLWSSERVFGVAKTRCKYPVSSETVRLVGTAMKDKWGDSPEREQASLSYLRGAWGKPSTFEFLRGPGNLRDGSPSSVFLKTCLKI